MAHVKPPIFLWEKLIDEAMDLLESSERKSLSKGAKISLSQRANYLHRRAISEKRKDKPVLLCDLEKAA